MPEPKVGDKVTVEGRPAVIATEPKQGPFGDGSREVVVRFADRGRELLLVRNWRTSYHDDDEETTERRLRAWSTFVA